MGRQDGFRLLRVECDVAIAGWRDGWVDLMASHLMESRVNGAMTKAASLQVAASLQIQLLRTIASTSAHRVRHVVGSVPSRLEGRVPVAGEQSQDKFIAMVSPRANVTLPLSEFQPRCMLHRTLHTIEKPRYAMFD